MPGHVTLIEAAPPDAPWANALPAQVMFAHSAVQYNAALFEQLPNLRMVQRTGIGVDNVNLEDATRCGIVVCNTPDGPTESTAEHTVAMLLNLAKRVKQGNDALAAGRFGPRSGVLIGVEATGKTLGLVGLGRIGRRVAQICRRGFDMQVLAYDPFVTPEQAAEPGNAGEPGRGAARRLRQPARRDAGHLPADQRERIALMKPGVSAQPGAGAAGRCGGAARSRGCGQAGRRGHRCVDPEPPELDSRLRNHPLIVATPHSATLTVEGRAHRGTGGSARPGLLGGERPPDIVNPTWDSPAPHVAALRGRFCNPCGELAASARFIVTFVVSYRQY